MQKTLSQVLAQNVIIHCSVDHIQDTHRKASEQKIQLSRLCVHRKSAHKQRSHLKATKRTMLFSLNRYSASSGCFRICSEFQVYLGYIITNKLNDDKDIAREVRNMFARTNILFRRFHGCSFIKLKVLLFKSYVVCILCCSAEDV